MVTSQQELVILPTKTQQQLDKQHVHMYEIDDLRIIWSDMNKNPEQFALKFSTVLSVWALKYTEEQ